MEDQGQGLLEFGTSVSVNDEIRRSIVSEIEETQRAIQKIKEEIAFETKTAQQVEKDRSHAATETRDLQQGSKETFERLTIMNDQVFRDLNHNTLRNELYMPSEGQEAEPAQTEVGATSRSSDSDGGNDDGGNDDGGNDDGEAAGDGPPSTSELDPRSMQGIRKQHDIFRSSLWKLEGRVQDMQTEWENIQKQHHAEVEKKENFAHQVQMLLSELSEAQLTTQNISNDCKEEDDRVRALKSKIRAMKESCEKVVKEMSDMKEVRDSKTRELSFEQEKLQDEVKTLAGTERRQQQVLLAKTKEIESLSATLEKLENEFAAYSNWKTSYEMQKESREKEGKERNAIFSLQKEMEAKWSSRVAQLDNAGKVASLLKKELSKYESDIAAAESNIEKASDEIARMNKTKDELQAILAQEDGTDFESELTEEEAKLATMQAELEMLLKQAEDADTKIAEKNRQTTDEVENLEKEYNQLRSQRKHVEEKASAMRTKLEEGTQTRGSENALKWERHLAILERGAYLLDTTKKREQHYLKKPDSTRDENL